MFTSGWRSAARLRSREPSGGVARAVVKRCQHDVELFEDRVLEIEPAVPQDVDLDAVQDRHPREALAQRLDFVALPLDVVARRAFVTRPRLPSGR